MQLLQKNLDALQKADYAQAFDLLEQVKVTSYELNFLRKEFTINGFA